MKKLLTISIVVLGLIVFLVGISLLMGAGFIVYNILDNNDFHPLYAFIRDETVQGIQTAGKICAVFGGATVLFGLFKSKREK